ncbi:class A sortase [Latilactobacillus sakei]
MKKRNVSQSSKYFKKVSKKKQKLLIGLMVGIIALALVSLLANKMYQHHELKVVENNIARINPKRTTAQEIKRNRVLQNKVGQNKANQNKVDQKGSTKAPLSAKFNFSKVKPINYSDSQKAQKYAKRYVHSGMIKIPAIGVRSAITEGMSNLSLYSSVGTAKPNQKMGIANYTLGGHNNYDYGRNAYLFSTLSAAKRGQLIYLTDFDQVYVYRIYDRQVINASHSEIIQDNQAKDKQPIVTLFTCLVTKPRSSDYKTINGSWRAGI